jgi:nitrite reductase (NO-forming)
VVPARLVTSLFTTIFSLALAACGDGESGAAADDLDADVVVETVEMAYEPSRIVIPAGETVTVGLVNAGALRHDLTLPDGTRSDVLQAGETSVMEIGPLTEDVVAWCSVPGHRTAGMELEIVVTD